MKFIQFFAMALLLAASQITLADTASEKEAAELMEAVGMKSALEQSMEQMLDVQINNNPSLAPFRSVMLTFFKKYMSYESLKPDIIRIYADAFTAQELKDIRDFYGSKTGQKAIKLMPQLMRQGGEIGAKRVQAHIGELETMIKAEAERLKKEAK